MKNECILATQKPRGDGYVRTTLNGKSIYAHRKAYILSKGEIPLGYEIDHLCMVRNCVNPNHLEAVTKQENTRRRMPFDHSTPRPHSKCAKGHLLSESACFRKSGKRQCRICKNQCNKNYRSRLLQGVI